MGGKVFDSLKKKLGSFINHFVAKGEREAEAPKIEAEAEAIVEEAKVEAEREIKPALPGAPPEARPAEAKPAEGKAPEEEKRAERVEREFAPKLGVMERLKTLVSQEVVISEASSAPIWSELELALLESDVSLATTNHLLSSIKSKIIGKRVAKGRLREAVREEIASSLNEVLSRQAPDVEALVESKKALGMPAVFLFVGPNGMGKTTAIAKFAALLKNRGHSVVLAASDCFRAAAVEQLEEHARKLGVEAISRGYGVDPTSVAFDAVAHAKAKNVDVVLIDTAGRQETSASLIREMEKMARVLKPDLKVFVAEAIAGKSVAEQVKKFNEAIGLNGVVLTKLDCDAKGGGALSIAYETGLPILFVGTGQDYGDFVAFEANWIVRNILAY